MRRTLGSTLLGLGLVAATVTPAFACAGLVAPNGTVRLLNTATLAGYHNGVEHYITSFQFQGGGAKFGSIVPLPDVPKRVTRGGDWTLQRLDREFHPQPAAATSESDSGGKGAEELYETEIDGLLITILKGGSRAIGRWARDEGFKLSPDAPEVLHFYSRRSKIFMAARFIPKKAEEQAYEVGDGVPIHLRIPTDNPWVPLRILGLGKNPGGDVRANVYLLTDTEPAILPAPVEPGNRGLVLEASREASDLLLDDLRSDKGMGWVPNKAWVMSLLVDSDARDLTYDLAVDASGAGQPDPADTGEEQGMSRTSSSSRSRSSSTSAWVIVPLIGLGALGAKRRRRTVSL